MALIIGFGFVVSQSQNTDSGSTGKNSSTLSTTISLDNPMTKGKETATVSLIQYSDFLCPSCSYFTTQMMPTIESKYIETGKVKFEFRPMAFIADGSEYAGEGAYCAVDQDKFWTYHDAVYNYVWNTAFSKGLDPTAATILTEPIVKSIATTVGLDDDSFSACMDSGEKRSDITAATTTANSYGITSTPYILVNGQKVTGQFTLDTITKLIESQL